MISDFSKFLQNFQQISLMPIFVILYRQEKKIWGFHGLFLVRVGQTKD